MLAGTETIVVKENRPTGETDNRGNQIVEEVEYSVENALIAFNTTSASFGSSYTGIPTETDITIYFSLSENPEYAESTGQIFEVRGEDYQQDGIAQVWKAPQGFVIHPSDHVVIPLKRRER